MSSWWNVQVDQWVWQRRATAELASVLAGHPDLPALSWTVRAAGCALTGQITRTAGAGGTDAAAAAFEAWRQALGLVQRPDSALDLGGARCLRAAGSHDRVAVLLAGDLDAQDEEADR